MQGFDRGARVASHEREVQRLVEGEVEQHVHLVAALAEKLRQAARFLVRLSQEHRIAAAARHERAQVAQVVVRVADGRILRSHLLDEKRDRIDAKPRQPQLQPEPDHLMNLVADERVVDV